MKIERINSPLCGEIGEQTCQLKQNKTWWYIHPFYIYGAYDLSCSWDLYVRIIKAGSGSIHMCVQMSRMQHFPFK
jgi:hypothetical protein